MIRHCVFAKFRREISAEERAAIYADLAALKHRVDGFLAMDAGPNVSPEHEDKGFSEGFIIDFRDAKARDDYLAHTEHTRIADRFVAALQGGVAGVLVFDLEV